MDEDKLYELSYTIYKAELIEKFFKTRVAFVNENKYPSSLIADPPSRCVIHVVPHDFQIRSIDIRELEGLASHLLPIVNPIDVVISDYNFDGIYFHPAAHEKHSYSQVFRDGRIEGVVAIGSVSPSKGFNLSLVKLQQYLVILLNNYAYLVSHFAFDDPYYLHLRLLNVEGVRVDPDDFIACNVDAKGRNKALALNDLVFPRYNLELLKINKKEVKVETVLLPFFDILWNTFGFEKAPNT